REFISPEPYSHLLLNPELIEVTQRKLRVTARLGLHARAAANLVRIASQFRSNIRLRRLDRPSEQDEADAKSILSILSLAAACGTDLLLTADGIDEEQAVNEITVLFVRQFDEGEPIERERNTSTNAELRVKGLGVSDGVAIGRVLRIQGATHDLYRASIGEQDVERERRRFRTAVRASRTQLESIKKRAERELGKGHAYIFDAHLLFLDDAKLTRDVEDYIVKEHANAEWAARVVGDRLLSIYTQISDEYLRERGSDIEDVIQRLLANLTGEELTYPSLSEDAVIVAQDILPSTVAELDLKHVKAIATDAGGWTSHMSIIARGVGLTAVVGLRNFYHRTRTGEKIIVDARRGEVILHPLSATMEQYQFSAESIPAPLYLPEQVEFGPVETLDGVSVVLRANVELPTEFEAVKRFGASGIGLFRSEFLLSRPGLMLSEEDQYLAYRRLIEAAGDDGAVVRLFDVGGEIGRDLSERLERNPALGLRAVRFDLRHPEVMRTQVRAILRAATAGPLSVVLPMVADVADVRLAKTVIQHELDDMQALGIAVAPVRIGAMIEVPSAVLTSEKIAREVDFFELGTNDLVQYTLAVDRGNHEVSDWFRTLHPAVLYEIDRTLTSARQAGIPVIACGEMASTPAYAVLLIGMGSVDLSMTPALIPRVRSILSKIDARSAHEIAVRCLECATADEVEEIVRVEFRSRWPDLFTPKSLPV
ncbi:MAG TPA: phosphoenolpyruvate--protein phosphotransferase, partial [Pyrinomonadaceae bacterium]|nr:phosphoenolpyruvate--protein phosphotransferase [Pyrinomonadaceae bacterium]